MFGRATIRLGIGPHSSFTGLPAAELTVSKHWRQLAHSDQGEDATVLLSGVTCTVSVPQCHIYTNELITSMREEVQSITVSVSVCLSVHLHMSKTTCLDYGWLFDWELTSPLTQIRSCRACPDLQSFLCYVTCGCGLVLWWHLCTSRFVEHIIFSW